MITIKNRDDEIVTATTGGVGVIVEYVEYGDTRVRELVLYEGGAWRLSADGFREAQTRGTADIAAPRGPGLRAWLRRHYLPDAE